MFDCKIYYCSSYLINNNLSFFLLIFIVVFAFLHLTKLQIRCIFDYYKILIVYESFLANQREHLIIDASKNIHMKKLSNLPVGGLEFGSFIETVSSLREMQPPISHTQCFKQQIIRKQMYLLI